MYAKLIYKGVITLACIVGATYMSSLGQLSPDATLAMYGAVIGYVLNNGKDWVAEKKTTK